MRRQKLFSVLPTLLTLGNAASGFGAITFAAKVGFEDLGSGHLFVASMLILLAMVFDALDGSAARWTKQTTDFGAQLDSLCDAISFGVAPAFLMLQFSAQHRSIPVVGRVLWVIAALYMVCAVLRLARFNVETEEDDSHAFFSGLPSPAAAATVASFPVAVRGLDFFGPEMAAWILYIATIVLPFVTLAVALLMVSRVRYPHVFNQLFRGKRSRKHVIQLVVALFGIFLVRELALPLIACYFAFYAPVRAGVRQGVKVGSRGRMGDRDVDIAEHEAEDGDGVTRIREHGL